jgi:DNA-binding CsgD family transcriptional regulator/predicted GIY-YIG superfamily endonuclease
MTYIYCIKDEEQIFYVGKTINLDNRKKAHIQKSFNRADMKDIIIQRQLKQGNDITLHVLEQCNDDEATDKEIEWIKQISRQGTILNNIVHNSSLSAIELNIVSLMANGYTSKEIADIRHRSIKTIEAIRYTMFKRIGVNSSAHLVYWCMKQGILV